MKSVLKIFILITLICLTMLGGFFVKKIAAAPIGLKILPLKVSYTLKPGETITDKIQLINSSGDAPVNVETSVEDFIPVAGGEGIKYVGRAEGVTTVRDWISFSGPKIFKLDSSETKEIGFTIKAPPNAEPGGHFGIIFFKATSLGPSQQLNIGVRIGALVFVTIPGNQLQKGEILEFTGPKFVQKSPVEFKIKFENTGTVHFEPKGSIKITDVFGRQVGDIPVQGKVVLPTGVRDLSAAWQTAGILLGRYKAAIEIKDGEENVLTADSIVFYAFPIKYAIYFVAAFLLIFLGLKFIKSKFSFRIVKK